jgi:hypothetical protein
VQRLVRRGVRALLARKERTNEQEAVLRSPAERKLAAENRALTQAEEKARAAIAKVPVLRELPEDKRRPTHVLVRGSFLNRGAEVQPGVPAVLHALRGPPNRAGLARWLVSPANPLTARVLVNRYWEQFFGRGLVLTSEDLGTRGALPDHAELLDWLATEVVRQGWSLKRLCRLIVTSATYRQSARGPRDRDPANVLLARGPRFRLEAEMIRDQALAVAGLLDRTMYGPPVFPPQPAGLWQIVYNGEDWKTSEGSDRYRRALYTFWRRTSPYPSLTTFDAPSREVCVSRRIRTNTPLQAFVTLNDPAFFEAARGLARRMKAHAQPVTRGFRLCVARAPTAAERAVLMDLVRSELAHFRSDAAAARRVAGADDAELAAWTVAANVLLNLDETLSR